MINVGYIQFTLLFYKAVQHFYIDLFRLLENYLLGNQTEIHTNKIQKGEKLLCRLKVQPVVHFIVTLAYLNPPAPVAYKLA